MTNKSRHLEKIYRRTAVFVRLFLVVLSTIGASAFAFLLIMKETNAHPELQSAALNFSIFFLLLIILASFVVIAVFLIFCIDQIEATIKKKELRIEVDISGYTVAKIAVLGLLVVVLLQWRKEFVHRWGDLHASFDAFLQKSLNDSNASLRMNGK